MQLPSWAIDKVKKQQTKKAKKPKTRDDNKKFKGMVVLLKYVQGSSEKLQKVFQKHSIATGFRPNMTKQKIPGASQRQA